MPRRLSRSKKRRSKKIKLTRARKRRRKILKTTNGSSTI